MINRNNIIRNLLVLIFSVLSLNNYAQSSERCIFPFVKDNRSNTLVVKSVVRGSESTTIDFCVRNTDVDGNSFEWVELDKNTYIEAEGVHYPLIKAIGIGISPDKTYFTDVNQEKSFSLTFPPISQDIKEINFIENVNSNWQIKGIELTSVREENTDSCSAILTNLQRFHNEGHDKIARNYLIATQGFFQRSSQMFNYVSYLGILSSNIWNDDPSEKNTKDYEEFLTTVIDETIKADSFVPNEELFNTLCQFVRDYIIILYKKQEIEEAATLASILHRWYEFYPNQRTSIDYARCLLDYCLLLIRDLHNYKEGTPLCEEYVDVTENVFGNESAEYAVALYNLNVCFSASQRQKEAHELLSKSIQIYENADNHDPSFLAQMKSSFQMGIALTTGKTDIEKDVMTTSEQFSLEECTILIAANKGSEALNSLLELKGLLRSDTRLDTLKYAATVNLVIQAYQQIGDYSAAQKEIDCINKEICIDNLSPEYAQLFYSNAGLICYRLNNYVPAKKYLIKALSFFDIIGEYNIEYAKVLSNLGIVCNEIGDKISAKWFIDESLSIYNDNIGSIKDGGNVGITLLNNSALIYSSIGENDRAISSLKQIVNSFCNDPNLQDAVSLAVNNLALLYLNTGNTKECISLLENTSLIIPSHEEFRSQNLAIAYYIDDNPQMEQALNSYNKVIRDKCINVFNYFTESDREEFWTYNARTLFINEMAALKFPHLAKTAYDNILFTKNFSLLSFNIIKDYVNASNDKQLKELYLSVSSLRNKITYNTVDNNSLIYWYKELRDKEHALYESIPDYKKRLNDSFFSCEKVKNMLNDNEVAIEFVYIPVLNDISWDDADLRYGALILSKSMQEPVILDLGDEGEINSLLKPLTDDPLGISTLYNNNDSTSIYNIIWKQIEPYVKEGNTIYFSPIGSLCFINHDAIALSPSLRLSEKYNLVQLSSTSKINEIKSNDNKFIRATVYGGINYDENVDEMIAISQKYSDNVKGGTSFVLRAEDERGRWGLLSGAKQEGTDISNILNKANVITDFVEWNEASEESFKNLSGSSPSIIHLATHGFYIDTYEKLSNNKYMQSLGTYSNKSDKLTRTGLLLAGANNTWLGNFKVDGIDDGILTADEISRLDLKNTELVVLSACETAKGYADEIDGVLGLQRGFKRAGAKTIVMSLWKVPDHATSILMTKFYENLANGNNVRESLNKAKEQLQEIDTTYTNPYYWAGFIVLD